MAVLALREYERITCGEVFDPLKRVIREDQHRSLEKFAEEYQRLHKVSVFQHGPRRSLVAQNFVGVINLGRDQIEILPKIECDDPQVRHNLAKMLSIVLDLKLYDDGATNVKKSSDSILEILIKLFCQKLWQCIHKGMVGRYECRSEHLTLLRGRVSVVEQARHNLARPDRLACIFDEFSVNNPLNQVLKAALRVLSNVTKTQENQRNIAELIFCFQDVDDIAPSAITWKSAVTDRLSARYTPVLSLAWLFIKGKSPDIVTGSDDGFALLFDMNQLFERFVGVISRRVFGSEGLIVSLQGPVRHLAECENGRAVFELRPDIVVHGANKVALVIDTKWKRLGEQAYREGVATVDVYQMFAYSSRYFSEDVVLLYPHHKELGDRVARRATYWVNSEGTDRRISVSTLDLRNLNMVPEQLRSLLTLASKPTQTFQ